MLRGMREGRPQTRHSCCCLQTVQRGQVGQGVWILKFPSGSLPHDTQVPLRDSLSLQVISPGEGQSTRPGVALSTMWYHPPK